jgi:catechol 2,3-dioxygenase-like lactoylglutathione lyase family enzyme
MFQEVFPILSTGDLPRALGFYRDLLGFEVTYQFPPEGEPGYVALDLGRSHLGIGAGTGSGWRPSRPTSPGASAWPRSPTRTATG